ncbi:hypothetical protein BDZ89DRAFT_1145164 [Hymenopellis radicata]|nr:hypothetical protein BDZ89DRAFT_1145164 [Hymenopellis radicata]
MESLIPLITQRFHSLGRFLQILFIDFPRRDGPDRRSTLHRNFVSGFLRGKNRTKAVDIVKLIYRHRNSGPGYRSKFYSERDLMFAGTQNPSELHYARPAISCWAIQVVGDHVHSQVGALTVDEEEGWIDDDDTTMDTSEQTMPGSPSSDPQTHAPAASQRLPARLAASKKSKTGQRDTRPMATWDVMKDFSIKNIAQMLQRRAGSVWYLTEKMAGPEKHGKVIVRKRRPHSTIQVAAITSFVLSRHRFANGYLAVALGIWLFATRAHIDIKRALSRMGLSISDTTVRKALAAMSDAGRDKLRKSVAEHAERGELGWRIIMDNVQGYALVREPGHGKQSVLKVGTAATAVRLYDCPPDAFKLEPYLARVIENKRAELTTDKLLDSLNFVHIDKKRALETVPFRTYCNQPSSCRSKDRDTTPGSNSEREIEIDGSHECVKDFDEQSGWLERFAAFLIAWYGGDGGTYATLKRLKKLLAATAPGEYASFMHLVVTPELWHMGSTMIGTLASNHFGDRSSADPSSLSRASTTASQKRPSDLSKPDYYPTVRSMKLIWNAQVLDCWRIHLCSDGTLTAHFAELASKGELPSLEDLLLHATILYERYGTLDAYERCLTRADWASTEAGKKIPEGTRWTQPSTATTGSGVNSAAPDNLGSESKNVEEAGFDGDRCLANTVLFKFEMGLWIEFHYAVSDGDIGRAWEIIKTWIFIFGGSTNTNYMNYLLETYCLLEYDAPPPLRVAIFRNWLANLAAKRGHHIPLDLMQEHHNHVIEELVEKMGKDFDDNFYRRVVAPNVHHVIHAKDGIETGFDISSRSNNHTSADTHAETVSTMTMYCEEQLHFFRSTRSLGHVASNLLNGGYVRLDGGKMSEFVEESTEDSKYLGMILDTKAGRDTVRHSSLSPSTPSFESPDPSMSRNSPSPSFTSRSTSVGPLPSESSEDTSIAEEIDEDDQSHARIQTGNGRRMFVLDDDGELREDVIDAGVEWMQRIDSEGEDDEQESDEENIRPIIYSSDSEESVSQFEEADSE